LRGILAQNLFFFLVDNTEQELVHTAVVARLQDMIFVEKSIFVE